MFLLVFVQDMKAECVTFIIDLFNNVKIKFFLMLLNGLSIIRYKLVIKSYIEDL